MNAYEKWDDFGKTINQKRVDVIVTHENKIQTTAEYRESLKKEEIAEVKYPATNSSFALYIQRSV